MQYVSYIVPSNTVHGDGTVTLTLSADDLELLCAAIEPHHEATTRQRKLGEGFSFLAYQARCADVIHRERLREQPVA